MTKLVKLKIDVTKIDKSLLFKGTKGTYLDATVFLEEDQDQYGNNGMITQEVSKEDRDKGVKGAILGNAKVVWEGQGKGSQGQQSQSQSQQQVGEDGIPF